MSLLAILYLTLIGGTLSLNEDQLKGLKMLLKDLPGGVFPTCQIVLFSEQVDFDTADENCKTFDIGAGEQELGNLATVNDEDKNRDLKLLLELAYPLEEQKGGKWGPTHWIWAGLRKTQNNQGKSNKYKAEDWEWANGEHPKPFEMWMPKQPDQRPLKKGEDGCEETMCYQNQMRINHAGDWDDTFKFRTHPYACDYQGKYILSYDLKSWTDAKIACEAAGLNLAKVRGPVEVEEMKLAMHYFIGERDPAWAKWDERNWVWLGGNDMNIEMEWVWIDDEPISWDFPWIKKHGGDNAISVRKQGIKMETGQDALCMNRDGKFDDSFVEYKLYPFACQCPGS